VSEVQAEDSQEWQSREARLDVVSQELPHPSVVEVLSDSAGAARRTDAIDLSLLVILATVVLTVT
jgi:hypothetical protein